MIGNTTHKKAKTLLPIDLTIFPAFVNFVGRGLAPAVILYRYHTKWGGGLSMLVAGAGRTVYNEKRTQGGGRMILAFCIDDQGGLAFNHRRQSRDRALVADLLAAAGARPVFCLPYSAGLFDPGTVTVVDAPGAVSADGILFLENANPATATPQTAVPAPLIVRNPIKKHPKRCRCGRLGCLFD